MKQKHFEAQHAELWNTLQVLLEKHTDVQTQAELPALYRRLCHSLALAVQRGYSPTLTAYLQQLVLDCHKRLYGTQVERPLTLRYWMTHLLPQRVRAEWRLLLLVLFAFAGSAVVTGLLIWFQPHWAYSFSSPGELDSFRAMYQPSMNRIGRGGDAGDIRMFGFYIWNNVSIGFRTFAGGIFGGIPALISITFNGLHLGVIGSWLSKDPTTRHTFWSFVITHASVEITGLLLSGMAGIRMGWALIRPGRLSRRHALLRTSEYVFPIVVGAALLTLLAAFIEGFWSANPDIPMAVKYSVGASCWLAVIGFFAFAGRER